MSLTGKQKRFLRGLANTLKATVFIGRDGINEVVIAALEQTVAANELVKAKLGEGFAGERHAAAEKLAKKTRCELVQVLGRNILLYRRHATAPKISLPD